MNMILVIEDHPEVREPLVKLLSHEGYQTISAKNGIDALQVVNQHRPDVVLLDLMMPKMDGLTFLRNLRSNPRLAAIPVVVMTGMEGSVIAQARELGVLDIFYKARFNLEDLLDRLRSLAKRTVDCSNELRLG